ncbi:MAG: hypothetical protein HQK51_20105, partial [Oligoflexia bacterium]|nr:hypothetical protein [Oligoflexia bacterium]
EARVPFLDHHFVELLGRIPINYKLKDNVDKYCFREAMREFLPDSIALRKKQRFNTPIDRFFQDNFEKLCLDLLDENNELNRNLFDITNVKNLLAYKKWFSYKYVLRENKLTAQFYARQLWNIVVLQLWYKMFWQKQSASKLIEIKR